jgi:phage-related protein
MPTNVLMFEFLGVDHFGATADHVGKKLDGIGSKLGSVGKTTAMALGKVAVGGVAAFGFAMYKGIQAATEYQTLNLKTAAVIKSTGNVAHLSVAGIDKLAGSLESISGVDETLIINSENVLATFTNVRNAAGKNNNVFDQATSTILDMSVALGTDLQGSTIQVGKALNDPIKGITALTKVGVTFTQAQKDQIKHLQKTGDLMGAQKIVLGELNREFGGAAKAAGAGFGGSLARLKDILDDTFRDLGMALLPMLTKVANWLADKLPGAIRAVSHAFQVLGMWLSDLGRKYGPPLLTFFSRVQVVLQSLALKVGPTLLGFFRGLVPVVRTVASVVGGALAAGIGIVVHYFRDLLFPALREGREKVFPQIRTAIATIAAAFRDHMDVIRAFGAVFVFILKVVGVALAILALTLVKVVIPVIVELIVIVFKAVGPIVRALLTITGVLINVIKGIAGFAVKAVSTIANVIGDIIGAFSNANKMLFSVGTKIIMGLIAGVKIGASFIGGAIKSVVDRLISPFASAIKWLLGPGKNFIMGLLRGIAALNDAANRAVANFITRYLIMPFARAINWLVTSGKNIIVGLVRGYVSMWVKVASTVANFINRYLLAPFARATQWLVSKGAGILSGLLSGLRSMRDRVLTWVGGIITSIRNRFNNTARWLFNAGFNVIYGLWQGLKSMWDRVTGWISGIASWIREHKGPVSLDARLLIPAGKAIMSGFLTGLKSGAGKAWSYVKSIGGKTKEMMAKALGWIPGSGWVADNVKFSNTGAGGAGFPSQVARWAGMVRAVLQMEGLDTSLVPRVLRQIQTESGGNPRALQMVHDVNWPNNRARGLMQVIPPTFRANHWPGTSWDQYDPMASIAAGLNYARRRYGPGLGFLGQGHGYDAGGLASGEGWLRKGPLPERILSPRQTQWFERAMSQGTRAGARGPGGGLTVVLNAPNYVGSRNELLDEFNRFARLGRLDPILKLASR